MSTVLVVEDSVAQREMIKDLLKGSGLEVTAVSGGIEALKVIQGRPPDLVLLDIVMPGTLARLLLCAGLSGSLIDAWDVLGDNGPILHLGSGGVHSVICRGCQLRRNRFRSRR